MANQADKILTMLVFLGFAMFAIINIGNVNQAFEGVASSVPKLVGGIARA